MSVQYDALPDKAFEPQGLEWVDDGRSVQISWADGHVSTFATTYLRKICPCAHCRGTHEAPPLNAKPKGAFTILSDAQLQVAKDEITVTRAYPVGNYALGFLWSDGHDDGIYAYRYLREMCTSDTNVARLKAQAQGNE